MAEDEGGLAGDRGAPLAAHELLALQPQKAFLHLRARPFGQRLQGAEPEDLPDDGRVLDQRLLLGCQRVEAGGDDPLDRLRERQAGAGARLGEHANVLLRVERVPARVGQELGGPPVLQRLLRKQRADQVLRLLVGER